jgi:hypothetical protein
VLVGAEGLTGFEARRRRGAGDVARAVASIRARPQRPADLTALGSFVFGDSNAETTEGPLVPFPRLPGCGGTRADCWAGTLGSFVFERHLAPQSRPMKA